MADRPALTALRREVFDLVLASERPVKAYELLALLQQKRGRATPPTVYRALDYLTKSGLIHRIESLNAYAACAHAPAGPQHVFLICEACGDVAEIESRDAGLALVEASQRRSFQVRQAAIEVRGACRECGARDR